LKSTGALYYKPDTFGNKEAATVVLLMKQGHFTEWITGGAG
jgi:hypothetical protein